MKRNLQFIISASAVSVIGLSALAQDSPTAKKIRPDYSRHEQPDTQHRTNRLNGAAKASDVIGMEVKNNQDEKLGKVEDLAVDLETGRIVEVIVSTGGFLGVGDRLTAVPPQALHHDAGQKILQLDANKEKLSGAPEFDMSNWNSASDSSHLTAVYNYYGEAPAFTFVDSDEAVQGAPDKDVSTRQSKATRNQDRVAGERRDMIPAARLGDVQRASKLLGMNVNNQQNEKLGDVDNMLLDLPSGRLVAVVVSSGGFLGMGDELSAVPPTALRFSADRKTLELDATKESLASAPHFKKDQWPDFAQPSYSGDVYRAYKVEPYFTTTGSTDADNTDRNVRDRNEGAVTPFDQGNNKADLATTARIRQEIMAGKDMSVNAHNVKIITRNGRVTLRGPVNSESEKQRVGDIAEKIARAENVDNQLEVKLTTSSN